MTRRYAKRIGVKAKPGDKRLRAHLLTIGKCGIDLDVSKPYTFHMRRVERLDRLPDKLAAIEWRRFQPRWEAWKAIYGDPLK